VQVQDQVRQRQLCVVARGAIGAGLGWLGPGSHSVRPTLAHAAVPRLAWFVVGTCLRYATYIVPPRAKQAGSGYGGGGEGCE
jgi:hypothetical protein